MILKVKKLFILVPELISLLLSEGFIVVVEFLVIFVVKKVVGIFVVVKFIIAGIVLFRNEVVGIFVVVKLIIG